MPPRGWHPTPEMVARRRATLNSHKPPFAEVFWARVNKADGCWEWTAGRIPNGYGRTRYNGRNEAAHRVAWELTHGAIPPGMFVCHHCDNPPCVRPDHLFLGTARDNTQDMIAKGRAGHARGESSFSSLTDMDVIAMRDMHARGVPVLELARGFRISDAAVRHIVYRRTWRHVA